MCILKKYKQFKEKRLDAKRNKAILQVCKALCPQLDIVTNVAVCGVPVRFCAFRDQKLIIRIFYVMLKGKPLIIEAEVYTRDKHLGRTHGTTYETRKVYTVMRCARKEYYPGDWEEYLFCQRVPKARKILQEHDILI